MLVSAKLRMGVYKFCLNTKGAAKDANMGNCYSVSSCC